MDDITVSHGDTHLQDPLPAGAMPTTDAERRETLRVLLVDDTPEIRFLLEVSLSREPNVRLVGQAENGRDAVEKIELLRPDLVIMDMQMPVMDGAAATRKIKREWPHVEIVGFTSGPQPESHRVMREAGADDSFEKINMKPLLDLVRQRASSRPTT